MGSTQRTWDLLSIQGLDTEEVRKSKEEFLEGKKTLAEDFQSFSKEEDEALWKLQQEKEAKEMKNKVNNIKQKGTTKHLQKRKQQNQRTSETASWGDWDITNIKVKDISQENKAYKEYKLKNSIKTVGEVQIWRAEQCRHGGLSSTDMEG